MSYDGSAHKANEVQVAMLPWSQGTSTDRESVHFHTSSNALLSHLFDIRLDKLRNHSTLRHLHNWRW